MSILVQKISKRFGAFRALDDVTIEIPSGRLVALLGPSGSGKTTLLRIIAGLESPDGGRVLYHDEDMTDRSPRDRNAGFVFQHYALFRHMSVYENVAFGLKVRRRPRAEVRARVHELLELVGLRGLENRYPSQLSGGQRQRVALARALAIRPRVLLLDEPFGALDAKVRNELRRWLRRLHDELHVTSVFVTHDQEEAFEVADKVVLMNRGRIEQEGTPLEVFERPANPFVMDFLGNVNVFRARVHDGRAMVAGLEFPIPTDHEGPSTDANIYIRPHELDVARKPNGHASLRAVVRHLGLAGPIARLELASDATTEALEVHISRERQRELALEPGDVVYVSPRNVRVFPDEDYSI